MKDTSTTTTNNIITSLNRVVGDSQDGAGINRAEDEDFDLDDLDELGAIDEHVWMDEDAARPPSVGVLKKRKCMT